MEPARRSTQNCRCFNLLTAAWLLMLLPGCGPDEILGRVEGRVTFAGEPVAKACLVFENPSKGVYILAPLDDDGKYLVSMDKGYGLPLGEYAVTVSPPPPDFSVGPVAPPTEEEHFPNIPQKYRDKATSGLKLKVQEGVNQFDVQMSKDE